MKTLKIIMMSSLLITSTIVMSEPKVIYDSGHTVSTKQYRSLFKELQEIPDFGKEWALKRAKEVDKKSNPSDPKNWLPITTLKLSPGKVKARPVQFNNMINPVCIIGSDERSLNWVKKYKNILLKSNAICWLVEAKTIADVKRVIKALDGISMSPSDGDKLSKFFKIKHYPVLVTARFLEQ